MFSFKYGEETKETWVYIACENMRDLELSPSKEYLGHLLTGKNFFTEEYYNWLKNWTNEHVTDVKGKRGKYFKK